jgi:hypothetical protein
MCTCTCTCMCICICHVCDSKLYARDISLTRMYTNKIPSLQSAKPLYIIKRKYASVQSFSPSIYFYTQTQACKLPCIAFMHTQHNNMTSSMGTMVLTVSSVHQYTPCVVWSRSIMYVCHQACVSHSPYVPSNTVSLATRFLPLSSLMFNNQLCACSNLRVAGPPPCHHILSIIMISNM